MERRRSSFRSRLLRQQLAVLTLAVVTATALYSLSMRGMLSAQFRQEGVTLALAVAGGITDINDAEASLMGLASQRNVVYAVLYDPTGQRVGAGGVPDMLPEANLLGSRVDQIVQAGVVEGHGRGPVRDVYAPIIETDESGHQRVLGVIRVGLATSAYAQIRRDFVLLAILSAVLVLGASFIAARLVTQRLTAPLAALTAGARAIGAGKRDARVDHTGDDEFGELADAFNTMAEDLNELLSGLEDTLGERTKELAQQRPRLESVLDSIDEGVLMLDRDGGIVLTNRRFRQMFQFPENALDGAHFTDFYDRVKNTMPEMPRLLQRARHFQTHPEEKSEDVFEAAGLVIERFSAPVRHLGDSEGRVVGRIEVYRDITRVVEVDRMKTEFISTVSHELRTPLTSIKGSLGLILGGATGDISTEAQELLTIARSNTERLIRLINDILDISKIESGKITYEYQEFDLGDSIQATVKATLPLADRRGISIELALPDDTIPVTADPDRIAQVTTNLLSNAIKFSPENSVINVRIRVKDRFYRVEITDRGPGIPEADIPKLFQKFSQLEDSDNMHKGGTGLGLAICRAIVHGHGGDIWVRSKVEHGSTFAFTLPRPREGTPQVTGTASASQFAAMTPLILILTRPENYQRIAARLRDAGLRPQADTDITPDSQPDVVLVDLDLPGSLDAVRASKQSESTRPLPIVLYEISGTHLSVTLPIIDWIPKPIDTKRVLLALSRITPARSGPSPHCLIVDDDPDVIESLRSALEAARFSVSEARDGHEALREIRERRPDVTLLDIALPGDDSFSVVRNLRESRAGRTPLVFLEPALWSPEERKQFRHSAIRTLRNEYDTDTRLFADLIAVVDSVLDSAERMTGDSVPAIPEPPSGD